MLADYVVALVATDDTEANIQRSCIESLEDFLGGDSKQQSFAVWRISKTSRTADC